MKRKSIGIPEKALTGGKAKNLIPRPSEGNFLCGAGLAGRLLCKAGAGRQPAGARAVRYVIGGSYGVGVKNFVLDL